MKSTDLLLRSAIQMKLDIIQITVINWPIRTALIVILINIATQAGAECGKLCNYYWRKTMTKADVKAELGGGADIMAWNRIGGRTPLHFASTYGNPASILALLTAGAAVLVGTGKGYTSLHFAAAFGTSVKFQTLPSAGGDVNARTDERYRSLYLAASSGAF